MSEEIDFNTQILGESTENLITKGNENISQLIAHMALQARQQIDVFSAELDHRIFDKENVSAAFSEFARSNRRSEIRILVKDTAKIVQLGHRLLYLKNRLPSFVQMKVVNRDYSDINRMFIVMDKVGYIEQPVPDQEKFRACYRSIPQGPENALLFNQIWNKSESDVNLRSLKL